MAVLIDPINGWFTQHGDWSRVFDPDTVSAVLAGTGPKGLIVEWVMPGDLIDIVQHRGREKVKVIIRGTHWINGKFLDLDKEWMQA